MIHGHQADRMCSGPVAAVSQFFVNLIFNSWEKIVLLFQADVCLEKVLGATDCSLTMR
jgi:hypothetical protein